MIWLIDWLIDWLWEFENLENLEKWKFQKLKKFLEWGLVKVQEEGIRTPCNPWCTPTPWCKPPPWCPPTPCCFLLKWNQNIFRSWITFLCAAAFSRILQVTLKSEFQLVWCICSDLCVKCSSAAPICAISHFHLHYNLVYAII